MSYTIFKSSYKYLMRYPVFLPHPRAIHSSCNSRSAQNIDLSHCNKFKNSQERHFYIKRQDLPGISFDRRCSTGKGAEDDQSKEKQATIDKVNPYSKPIPPDATKIRRYYLIFEKYLYLAVAASLDFYKAFVASNEWKLMKLTAIKLYTFIKTCIETYLLPMLKKWIQDFKANVEKARREDVKS